MSIMSNNLAVKEIQPVENEEEYDEEYASITERDRVGYETATVVYDWKVGPTVARHIEESCDRLWKPTKLLLEYASQIEEMDDSELSDEQKSIAIGDFVRTLHKTRRTKKSISTGEKI